MILTGDESVYIIRRSESGVDDYGNPTHSTASILIANCLVGWGGSSSPQDPARDALDGSVTLYLPPGTSVADGDLFEIAEELWEKDGDPQNWDVVNGFEVGVVVHVRRRRG
jgi:hypothetical protein